MKAAIIEPVGGHGGMNYYDISLANGLHHAGINIILYTCDKTQIQTNLAFRVKRTFKNIWGETPKILRGLNYIKGMLKSMIDAKMQGIVLIHFHFFHYTKLERISLFLSHFFRFKIIITVHDVESFVGRQNTKSVKTILEKADKLISHNIISKNELINTIKLPEHNIHIIPHGNYKNDIPYKLSPEKARQKLKIQPGVPVILFFGQIKKVKGLDILLNALPEVIKTYPDLKLIIAGKIWKDKFDTYENIINREKLTDTISHHAHYIADDEVPIFYYASDIVVLPYRRIYQSGVLLMAMSYQKPVIVPDLEGMTEIIKDGINGFVFKTGDAKSLSEKLIQAFGNTEQLDTVARSGFNTVSTDHHWGSIGEKTAALYKDVVQ